MGILGFGFYFLGLFVFIYIVDYVEDWVLGLLRFRVVEGLVGGWWWWGGWLDWVGGVGSGMFVEDWIDRRLVGLV